MPRKKTPPTLMRCPLCGKLIATRFPIHDCPGAPPGSPNATTPTDVEPQSIT